MNIIALNSPPGRRNRLARDRGAAAADVEAIILAAGRGSRLASYTDDRPKCLVEVGGAPLIEHQLQMLDMAGIRRVLVVAGYRADEIRTVVGDRARIIENPEWEDTNSVFSLSLCRGHVDSAMLVMNCDVLVHPLALQRLLAAPGSAFVYDSSSGDADEHMKVALANGRLTAMSKALPPHRVDGENVGILYFESRAAQLLLSAASELVCQGQRNVWMAAAVEQVASAVPLHGVNVSDLPWIEIDFPDDLERACTKVWRQVIGALAQPMRLAS
jgi:L-glutamine-phosphate cytidylyltransferase